MAKKPSKIKVTTVGRPDSALLKPIAELIFERIEHEFRNSTNGSRTTSESTSKEDVEPPPDGLR